jgi:hypothetical protein
VARPKVIIDCVASRYQGPDERIVEISHGFGDVLGDVVFAVTEARRRELTDFGAGVQ